MSRNGDKNDTSLKKGLKLARSGRYDDAVEYFDEAIEIAASDLDYAYYNKGLILFMRGQYYEALECFDKTIKLNPTFVYAWYNKGLSLGKIERYGEAIACFNKITETSVGKKLLDNIDEDANTKFYAWYNKGISLSKLKKYYEALECFDEATMFKPQHALAWYNKGYAHGMLMQYQRALECFENAIRIDKFNANFWHNKCFVLYKRGEKEKDEKKRAEVIEQVNYCFQEAKKIDCDFPYTWNTQVTFLIPWEIPKKTLITLTTLYAVSMRLQC